MTSYRVKWEIDVEADSPMEAAVRAKWYQIHGDWSSIFDVTWLDGKGMREVDLDEDLPPEVWEALRSLGNHTPEAAMRTFERVMKGTVDETQS